MGYRVDYRIRAFVILLSIAFFCPKGFAASNYSLGAGGTPVTEEELKSWTDWVKKSIYTLDQREKRIEQKEAAAGGVSGKGEQAIDLSSADASAMAGAAPAAADSKAPRLETYFDFALVNQPGTYDSLAFDNYHSFVFFDITPAPNLSFSFNLLGPNTFPIYYELDYQYSKRLTLRAGKIFIPFDDLSIHSPHNIFGGREGLAQLMPSGTTDGVSGNNGGTFLPSLWTELGIGLKYMLIDTSALQLESHFTISNGFPPSGQDPVTLDIGPNFSPGFTPAPTSEGSGSGTARRNKSYDFRVHALFANRFGIGASMYTGQWNNDQGSAVGPGHLFLTMTGMDGQIYFAKGVELRGGFALMNV